MRKMTMEEFKDFVAEGGWTHEQTVEVVEGKEREVFDDEGGLVGIPHTWGYAEIVSRKEGVTITYTEVFDYDNYQSETFETSTDGPNFPLEIDGVEIEDCELTDILEELPGDFTTPDYSGLEIDEEEEIEEEESDMEEHIVERDNNPNLKFHGERVASAASSPDQAMGSSYSGSTGRWTTLRLYKTAGGKYICSQISHTQWQGEHDRHSGAVCETQEEVMEFFGHGWLAKELYDDAGIEDVETVE